MAITFKENIDVLRDDLVRGGFFVHAVRTLPHSLERVFEIDLGSGATVCWDKQSYSVWAEGPHPAIAEVEDYLRRLYQGPRLLRFSAVQRSRAHLRLKRSHEAGALWLLRSETFPARTLRQVISVLPSLRLRRHRRATA